MLTYIIPIFLFQFGIQKAQELICMTGCKTCSPIPNCGNCISGFYKVRDGAYSHCRKCPPGCAECLDPRYTKRDTCTVCKDGYYGYRCTLSCSEGCYFQNCSRKEGTCYQNKCKQNYEGTNCDKCLQGRFGHECRSKCPGNCVMCSTGTTCGTCKDGFWGDTCQQNCSTGCSTGACLKQSGDCHKNECRTGFVGQKCDECASERYGINCDMVY